MEDGGDSTPFWLQSGTNTRPADRLRRRVSSVFFSSGLVVFLLLLITAVFFLAFVVPSTLSLSAQILRPNSVKRSWDSLNIVLVLVAVVFGFLSKIKNDDRQSYYDELQTSPNKQNVVKKSPKASSSDQWYNNYNNLERQKANTVSNSGQWYGSSYHRKDLERKDSILRRNSSSYPDLREFSSNRWDYQHRFYDDFHIDVAGHRSVEEFEAPQSKTILVVDTLSYPKEETESSSSPVLPAKKRAYERTEGRKESRRISSRKFEEKHQSVGERKLTHPPSIERANGNATKDFFTSIYLQKNKKKSQKNPQTFQIPPPPPPAFQNLVFSSKKHKRKRSTITIPLTPPNPNPTQNPPKIINMKSFDENSNSGGESPLNRTPPPPPPPPGFFKTSAWKFVVQGDYVRVDSSRSGSPDLDDVDSDVTPTASPLFHPPSPDVNTKADSFINTFRAKLKMEKNHSITKRQVGLSTLAPN